MKTPLTHDSNISTKLSVTALLLLCTLYASTPLAAKQIDVSGLLRAAQEASTHQRYVAIDDLGERAEGAAEVVPVLVGLLADDDVQIRWRSARSLGDFGSLSAVAVPKLRGMLENDKPIVKMHAAAALGRIGDSSEPTLQALLKLVTHEDARVARVAIAALRNLKPGSALVAAAFAKALQSNDQAVTSHAIEAMVEAGAKAVPFLKQAIQQPETAYIACVVIAEIGPDAADTVPELTELLKKTSHSKLLIEALLAIAKIGPAAKSAAPTVLPLLNSESDTTVPVAAAFALGSIGASDAIDPLREAANGEGNPFLQMVASWSVSKLNPGNQQDQVHAETLLTQGLESDNERMRTAAAKLLVALKADEK